MTKAEIVNEISLKTGTDRKEVLQIVESFMDNVKISLANGENVYLREFGSFIVKHRAEKVARNINKNISVVVPAHDVPAFKPSDSFKLG
ncbi:MULTISPECIES: HU family DNA-binding protein [Bacteroidaceae]|jgi:DNA-binding protein HU-beta|uniref:HU family DNA-binding protein n=1 Tax=Bacteroidaceae TaxID=815 RepID=UPI00321B138B